MASHGIDRKKQDREQTNLPKQSAKACFQTNLAITECVISMLVNGPCLDLIESMDSLIFVNANKIITVMNTWLHRITGGDNALPLSSALLEKGYLSIGWCDFSSEEYLARLQSGGSHFDQVFLDEGWGRPRNRWNLWRFVDEMAPGDWVVVPRPYTFSVYEILEDKVYTNESIDPALLIDWNGDKVTLREDSSNKNKYLYNKDEKIVDLGFYRHVKEVVKNVPRAEYADQDLYSRMKIRQTNANINDLRDSVENAIENFRNNKPLNLKASIQDSASEIVLKQIRAIPNDSKFEDLVGWYLESIGGRLLPKPAKNESPTEEGDADCVAIFDKLGVAIMVQVKKHTDQTNSWAIEQIKAYKKNHSFDDYTTILWVISSCDSFSEEAKQLAQESGVKLIDGLTFSKMILDAGLDGMVL